MIKNIFFSLINLKKIQFLYRLKYIIFTPKRSSNLIVGEFNYIDLASCPEKSGLFYETNNTWNFNFLNLHRSFSKLGLDWSFTKYGILWAYNLNYFDWLNQSNLTKEKGLELLKNYYSNDGKKNPIILHPYPTSLRIINVAKFIAKHNIFSLELYSELVSDIRFISERLEYHLLGNHLLENGFALYIGGLMTNQKELLSKGKKLLAVELNEQIKSDGMHYERSPMYHLIILERLLDALNFAKASGDDLETMLRLYAVRMTGLAMNWEDLDRIPMMQDSAYDIALTVPELLKYSKCLLREHYPFKANDLKDSCYRKLKSGRFSLFANVGSIGPSYQPGHAHADELNFELFYGGEPIIVDTGVSTYEKNDRRLLERSTSSHNCIVVSGNSSDIWSGFRVGRRANVQIDQDDDQKLRAKHDGFSILTSRAFDSSVADQITLTDKLERQSTSKRYDGKGYLHLHPDVHLEQLDKESFLLNKQIKITIKNDKSHASSIELENYRYANGYNTLIDATVISYSFFEQTIIQIHEVS